MSLCVIQSSHNAANVDCWALGVALKWCYVQVVTKWCYVQVVTDNTKLQVAYADFYYTDQEGRITGRSPSRWLDYKHLLARNPGDGFSVCCVSVLELLGQTPLCHCVQR